MKTELLVKGMHCRSCEMLIKEELIDVPGVSRVEADSKAGTVVIESDKPIDMEIIKAKIKELNFVVQ